MVMEYPWDVRSVPNFSRAPSVEIVDGERLDRRTFWRRYVLQNRPCLIKRAVVGWPASRRWANPDYVISKVGDVNIRASCAPKIEGFGLRSRAEDVNAVQRTYDGLLPPEPVRHLLPRLRQPDSDVLFIELRPSDAAVRRLSDDLTVGGGRFTFLLHPPRPRFMYGEWAAMFYRNSYSDWHFHPGADAIMCQVLGTKDVLLLPPTQRAWDQIVPIHRSQWKVYDVDLARTPAYLDIQPHHVVVEPGDGLFLPLNWWHAVQARPREFGITVPIMWDSPYRDLRQPATRHFLRVLWEAHPPLAAAELLASTYGTLTTAVRLRWSGSA